MGTTLVALALTSDASAIVLHVGDSRLYRFRNGRLEQLTHDHTVIADLIRAGKRAKRTGRRPPLPVRPHTSDRVIPEVDIDHSGLSCEPGDRLMLCSDGLFKALSLNELKVVLASEAGAQASADQLVTSAVEREAEDNVTAMVIDVR